MVVDDHKDRILWDCGSPLYDSYELVSLTHIIERHFMFLPSLPGAGKGLSSRTPSDLEEKVNRVANTIVDLCCSSDSTTGALLCGVFKTKWWKRKKKVEEVGVDHYKKKNKNMFCKILVGIKIISTSRSCSPKM